MTDEEILEEHKKCIRKLVVIVEDVLPQMGKIVLQDYANLNDALVLSSKLCPKGE